MYTHKLGIDIEFSKEIFSDETSDTSICCCEELLKFNTIDIPVYIHQRIRSQIEVAFCEVFSLFFWCLLAMKIAWATGCVWGRRGGSLYANKLRTTAAKIRAKHILISNIQL